MGRFICAYMDPYTRAGCFEQATTVVKIRDRTIDAHVCAAHARELIDRGVAEEPK
jgi:hypothetical protein